MLSRRTLIGKAAAGAAAALVVGAARTGAAATAPLRSPASPDDLGDPTQAATGARAAEPVVEHQALDRLPAAPGAEPVAAAPAPWELLAPYHAGATVAHGWQLGTLTPVRDGAAVVTLQNAQGHTHRIHLCRNDGTPQGVLHTRRIDLVVMNQGYGALPTEEHFGQAVATLAQAVAANEATVAAPVFAALLPHAERVERFAAVEGPLADGKLR